MHVDIQPFAEYAVAPYMGAWIETDADKLNLHAHLSHPTWVRGLKLEDEAPNKIPEASHPTWVRGLKQAGMRMRGLAPRVAPYMGAWIETEDLLLTASAIPRSHPTWVRGLKPKVLIIS